MEKFKSLGRVLSKDEQRKIMGATGDPCSMTWQDPNGGWHTETGTCAVYGTTWATEFGGGVGIGYCQTASFSKPVPLSSNGGRSRCPDA